MENSLKSNRKKQFDKLLFSAAIFYLILVFSIMSHLCPALCAANFSGLIKQYSSISCEVETQIFIQIFFLKIYFYWKGRFTERKRHKDLVSAGSFPKWLPAGAELSQSEAISQELFLGHPRGCRVPKLWAILHRFSRPQAGSWVGSGAAGM